MPSPGLDGCGDSVRRVQVCRELSARLGLHVFASEYEDALLTCARLAAEPAVDVVAVEDGGPPPDDHHRSR